MTEIYFSEGQLGDFKEVGNIGAGRASGCLAELMRRRCLIDVCGVSHIPLTELAAAFDQPENPVMVSVSARVSGEVPALMFIVLKRLHAHTIVRLITKNAIDSSGKDLTFTAQFALKQVSEAMVRAFSGSINDYLGTKSKQGMPEIHSDSWPNLAETVQAHFPDREKKHLVVHANFFDPEKTFEGKYFYVLGPDAQGAIMARAQSLLDGKTLLQIAC